MSDASWDSCARDLEAKSRAELLELRAQIVKEKQLVRRMLLVNTAFATPSSTLARPVIDACALVQKHARRIALHAKFKAAVRACVRIQTAFRRHAASTKWRLAMLAVPERATKAALFNALRAEREKSAELERALADAAAVRGLAEGAYNNSHTIKSSLEPAAARTDKLAREAAALVFVGEEGAPYAFATMYAASRFFHTVRMDPPSVYAVMFNRGSGRAMLVDTRTPSEVQGRQRQWTEVAFRGQAIAFDNSKYRPKLTQLFPNIDVGKKPRDKVPVRRSDDCYDNDFY